MFVVKMFFFIFLFCFYFGKMFSFSAYKIVIYCVNHLQLLAVNLDDLIGKCNSYGSLNVLDKEFKEAPAKCPQHTNGWIVTKEVFVINPITSLKLALSKLSSLQQAKGTQKHNNPTHCLCSSPLTHPLMRPQRWQTIKSPSESEPNLARASVVSLPSIPL